MSDEIIDMRDIIREVAQEIDPNAHWESESQTVIMEAALKRITEMQQEALGIIRQNGFVFEDIGKEPGNWQHLAFTLYTTICEIDTIARGALAE